MFVECVNQYLVLFSLSFLPSHVSSYKLTVLPGGGHPCLLPQPKSGWALCFYPATVSHALQPSAKQRGFHDRLLHASASLMLLRVCVCVCVRADVLICCRLRTFQLSKAFLPVDMPTPVQALGRRLTLAIGMFACEWSGQSLQDGIPLVVVTRGCFGREMDFGPVA